MEMSFDLFAPMVEEEEMVDDEVVAVAVAVTGAGEEDGGIDIPLGNPRRRYLGFAIPASWSFTLMPRGGIRPQTIACS
jgi:hypothetical protein